MTYIPVAAQLYSVRKELAENPLATLKSLKAMGYEGVEFAGAPAYSPSFYASLLRESGLVCCGWHMSPKDFSEENFERTVRLCLAVGATTPVLPWLPASTLAEWKEQISWLNQVAEKLAHYGMRIGYHCHGADFKPLENGELPWHLLFRESSPRVLAQLDTGNAMEAGATVMEEMARLEGRCRSVHAKPYSLAKGFDPVIGEDDCPWKELVALCRKKQETDWFVIEYESPAFPPLEAMDRCLKGLRKFLD